MRYQSATVAIVIAAGAFCAPNLAQSQADSPVAKIDAEAAAAQITVQSLRSNVSVLMGSGGNIAVLATDEGKFLVDTGIVLSRVRLAAALDSLGTGQIRYAVNTHWHWDHTSGNEWVRQAGATIIAHRRTVEHLSRTVRVPDWNWTFEPVAAQARPTIIVDNELTLEFSGETVLVRHYDGASHHTDGDLYVFFTQADVLVTGDTFWNGLYPFIDHVAGGGIDGMIAAANVNIARAGANTLVIPGHGPVGSRADLIAYRDMLATIRDNVAELKRQGKSVDEAIAARPTAAYDAKWGGFVIDPAFFTRLVYNGL